MFSRHYEQSVTQSDCVTSRPYLVLIMTAAMLVLVARRTLALISSISVDTVTHTTGIVSQGRTLGR